MSDDVPPHYRKRKSSILRATLPCGELFEMEAFIGDRADSASWRVRQRLMQARLVGFRLEPKLTGVALVRVHQ